MTTQRKKVKYFGHKYIYIYIYIVSNAAGLDRDGTNNITTTMTIQRQRQKQCKNFLPSQLITCISQFRILHSIPNLMWKIIVTVAQENIYIYIYIYIVLFSFE